MAAYKQDLPPKEGFGPIEWAARGPKRLVGGLTQFVIFVSGTTVAWFFFARWRERERIVELEMRDARVAIEPFIFAEREREFLKYIRRCRDEENELMKNVKDWKTGTFWGEPVFHNVRNKYIKPSLHELVAHLSPKDQDVITYVNYYS